VSGRNNSSGSFQLCVNSFNNVADPSSDCPTGVVLCDKSSFVVEALTSSGSIQDEANNTCLDRYNVFDRRENSELNSAWYKWVAGTSGPLTFTITPSNPADDIDFAVFELPNGLNDCGGKELLRCMASGEQGGCNFSVWEPCTGPTGLKISSSDDIEDAGCNVNNPCVLQPTGQDDDNFVSAIQMEAGKAYALIVNNYTQSGAGFSIDFGGTGEFLGPEADFITDDLDGTVCFGDPVTFFDQSTFGDLSIMDWHWNFGEGATPQQATGPGPHRINYSSGGIKSVALTVQSETGCLVTTIGTLIVEDPFDIQADIVHQTCPESVDGSINLQINSKSSITSIQWSNGMTGNMLQNLPPGEYSAVITNFNGCDTLVTYNIEAPMPLEIEDIITRPSCGGGSDGAITLDVTGQAPPFRFDFNRGGGFQTSNSLNGLPAGIYTIEIQDANGCISEVTVPLGEINIELDPDYEPITPPSCFGFTDGQVEARIINGTPPYTYDWDLDGTFEMSNILTGVGGGTLFVAIRDGMGCTGFQVFEIPQPDPLIVQMDTINIACFGETNGMAIPQVSGGTKSYQYDWSNGTNDSIADNLSSGQYFLTVTDANGCQTPAAALISEPPPLMVLIDSTRDVICFGDQTGAIFFNGNGGTPPFMYSVDGANFSDALFFEHLRAGSYQLTIKDNRGCTLSTPVQILQPEQLIVDAGSDTTINLGFTAQLIASHQPVGKPVVYTWSHPESLDCENCPFPISSPLATTTYSVQVVDDAGCIASDQVTIFVYLNRPVFIPNSITPNGDGYNDKLAIYGGPATKIVRKIQIFDRWGEMVYEGQDLALNDETLGWDGTYRGQELNPGVFVYVAEVEFIDNSVLQFEGDLTLIR
ncbi:MAG: gliding motility-associated C-terminal domain-containing protein, partial [Saprospiraceae bacterium]|nr:gliding motility-associated C-terminal domain-containing protein [Saprospiraceae bacterium]